MCVRMRVCIAGMQIQNNTHCGMMILGGGDLFFFFLFERKRSVLTCQVVGRMVWVDRIAKVTQITSLYKCGKQKSISKHIDMLQKVNGHVSEWKSKATVGTDLPNWHWSFLIKWKNCLFIKGRKKAEANLSSLWVDRLPLFPHIFPDFVFTSSSCTYFGILVKQ